MRKKILAITGLVLIVVLFIAAPVMASVITGATHLSTITITNVGTATTNVSVPFTLSTNNLINNGYIESDCDNTAIRFAGADVAYMPAPGAGTDWCLFVPSVAVGNSTAQLYTGGTVDMLAKLRYFPAAGGMAVTDHASLEPGNNFEIELSGFVDTTAGANKYLVNKTSALNVWVSSTTSGTITASIYSPGRTYSTIDDTDLNLYAGSNTRAGQKMAMPVCTIYSVAFELTKNGGPTGTGYARVYKVSDGSLTGTIGQIDVSTIAVGQTTYTFTTTPIEITSAADYYVVFEYSGGGVANYVKVAMLSGGGTGNFAYYDGSWHTSAGADSSYDVYADVRATVTGITSGEHTVTAYADTTNIGLIIDDGEPGEVSDTGALGAATTANNANNWTLVSNGIMPYVEYITFDVSAAPVSAWEWENDTTFHDSIGSNDATPSFRTTSSDVDVSAALTSFAPINLSEAGETTFGGETNFISSLPDALPNMYDEGETGGLFGLSPLINPVLATSDIPEAVFWYPIAFVVAIGLGFAAYAWTRQLLVQAVVSGVVMAGFSIGGVLGDGLLPFWTVAVFILEAIMLTIIQDREKV